MPFNLKSQLNYSYYTVPQNANIDHVYATIIIICSIYIGINLNQL